MGQILNILNKEMIQGLRNWVLIILILFPILVTLLVGTLFNQHMEVTVAVPEDIQQNEAIYQRMIEVSEGMLVVKKVPDFAKAREMVEQGEVPIAVSIPEDGSTVKTHYAKNIATAKIALSIMQNAVYERTAGNVTSFEIDSIEIKSDNLDYVAGFILFGIIFIAISHSVTMICTEKEKKTLDYLLTSPVAYHQIIIGKELFVIIMTSFSVLLTVSIAFLIGLVFNTMSILLTLGYSLLITFAFAGIGLIISGLSKSLQDATSYSIIAMMPLALLGIIPGGFDIPVLRLIDHILPSMHAKNLILSGLAVKMPDPVHLLYIIVFDVIILTAASLVLRNSYND